ITPLEERKLDEERNTYDCSFELCHQSASSVCGAARCKQIVNDQDSFARGKSIDVDLECIGPIFELVCLSHGLRGKFFGLADRHKPGPQPVCKCATENKATGFNSNNFLDPRSFVFFVELVD